MENRGIAGESFFVTKNGSPCTPSRKAIGIKTEHILSVMCPRWERNENAVVSFPVWGTLPIA